MPIDIQGWIEFSPFKDKKEREDKHSWITWMNVGSLIEFNDEVNWIIFGNPSGFNKEAAKYSPIAKNRGFPDNPAEILQSEINKISEHERKYGKGELFGFTHFYFNEVDKIDWEREYGVSIITSDCGKLLDLTRRFMDLKKLESEQIRFTVWYNW